MDVQVAVSGKHSARQGIRPAVVQACANSLRDVPMRELKDLGGWKSEKTLITVYLQPDQQAQRTALSRLSVSNGK
jgi:hypothetical protein